MMNSNSTFKQYLASVCLALAISGCASSDDDMVRCNDNQNAAYTGCGEYNRKNDPEWKESATALPPLPLAENLRPIDAFEAKKGYDYLLDRASITRGSDGVMRYIMVVRSPQGGSNAFYEGLRCETFGVRTYAYASSKGEFRRASSERWKPAARSGARGYQSYLANVIMCDRDGWAWDASKAVEALDAQFTSGGVRIEPNCKDLQRCAGIYKRHDD